MTNQIEKVTQIFHIKAIQTMFMNTIIIKVLMRRTIHTQISLQRKKLKIVAQTFLTRHTIQTTNIHRLVTLQPVVCTVLTM